MDRKLSALELTTIHAALDRFYELEGLRGQHHVKPMHQYVAMRLVVEGGFLPEEISPRPPLTATLRRSGYKLEIDEELGDTREETVLGGLKTKDVDVVVAKDRLGPVLCISVKGTGGAFRNLTNRMEEAVGDCTNLHMTYPGLVYGFLHLIKCNHPGDPDVKPNDVSLDEKGRAADAVQRYDDVLKALTGRELVRNEISRYEAIALVMVDRVASKGVISDRFPDSDSPTTFRQFFPTLYRVYDRRYPYVALKLRNTERVAWDPASPAFHVLSEEAGRDLTDLFDYSPRLA
ncbi:MAG: hypothetical protein U9R79_12535 [Armatimonadota bacterium]|nr:hypothetical protein [Armatimonadota bacterium]